MILEFIMEMIVFIYTPNAIIKDQNISFAH